MRNERKNAHFPLDKNERLRLPLLFLSILYIDSNMTFMMFLKPFALFSFFSHILNIGFLVIKHLNSIAHFCSFVYLRTLREADTADGVPLKEIFNEVN